MEKHRFAALRRWLRVAEGAPESAGLSPRSGGLFLLLGLALFLAFTYLASAGGPLSRYFVPLLFANGVVVLFLLGLIGYRLGRLWWNWRQGVLGSRLAGRLVLVIGLLSVTPAAVVFGFSWQYLDRGVDSWFSSEVKDALDQALTVARQGIERYRNNTLAAAESIAVTLMDENSAQSVATVIRMRDQYRLAEVTLFGANGQIIATSSENLTIAPHPPRREFLAMGSGAEPYAIIEPEAGGRLVVKVLVPVLSTEIGQANRILYVEQPVPQQLGAAADSVQVAYERYHLLLLMREPMKTAFQLSLGMALLLTVLAAIWMGFFVARRLAAPIARLAAGTRAVARGEFVSLPPMAGTDEMGILLHSFNSMTRQLAHAQKAAAVAQAQAERRRVYLETLLAQLSSGIMTFNGEGRLMDANTAARNILQEDLESGMVIPRLGEGATMAPFWETLQDWFGHPRKEMQREVSIERAGGRQYLLLHGAPLAGEEEGGQGHVLVFDDVSALVGAQRVAAWSEVARRLAHEIKNPLTPIQLSAERLRRKYLERLGTEGEALDRATRTIINQVETLKVMVDAFSEYARQPQLQIMPIDLNAVVAEALDLYREQDTGVEIRAELMAGLPPILADANRLRQVLHNLLRNAIDALLAPAHGDALAGGPREGGKGHRVLIRTAVESGPDKAPMVVLTVMDNGPGFPAEIIGRVFEPYVTTKVKGSGLGLAIVRRIVEEHGGEISVDNQGLEGHGARVVIRFPAYREALAEERIHGKGNTETVPVHHSGGG